METKREPTTIKNTFQKLLRLLYEKNDFAGVAGGRSIRVADAKEHLQIKNISAVGKYKNSRK